MFCIIFHSSFNSQSLSKLGEGDKKEEEGGGGDGDGREKRRQGTLVWLWGPGQQQYY